MHGPYGHGADCNAEQNVYLAECSLSFRAELPDISSIGDIASHARNIEAFLGQRVRSLISVFLRVAGDHDLGATLSEASRNRKAHSGCRAGESGNFVG